MTVKPPLALLLSLSLSPLVGCVSAKEQAMIDTRKALLSKKEYTYSCAELAQEAAGYYRDEGFELPSEKDDDSGLFSFHLGGSSSTSSETSGSFSFGTGSSDLETEALPPQGPPTAVVNTAPEDGTAKRFACWDRDNGARMVMTTSLVRDGKVKATRDYEDELNFMKRVDEDGYDQAQAKIKAAGDAAE